VHFVREKCPRKKPGDVPAKPGKLSWIWGTKEKFFEARKDAWLSAVEAHQVGMFYDKMTKLYIVKYG
jgi:hypothetical protein